MCVIVCFSCAGDRDMFSEAEDHRQWLEQTTCHVQVWVCVGVCVCGCDSVCVCGVFVVCMRLLRSVLNGFVFSICYVYITADCCHTVQMVV